MTIEAENDNDAEDFKTCLSKEPDGMGYYYGHYKGSRIDVLPPSSDNIEYRAYVDGDEIDSVYDTLYRAEIAARLVIDHMGKLT